MMIPLLENLEGLVSWIKKQPLNQNNGLRLVPIQETDIALLEGAIKILRQRRKDAIETSDIVRKDAGSTG
jgi:hypothetical protein